LTDYMSTYTPTSDESDVSCESVDFDGSGLVDFGDFSLFVPHFERVDCGYDNGYCDGTDLDQSHEVDLGDFSYFAFWFGESCEEQKTQFSAFLSSRQYDGNLGGVSSADKECQDMADAAGLSGSFKAWLSDSTIDAKDRFNTKNLPYYRVDGIKVADDFNNLIDGNIDNPIDVDENGITIPWSSVGVMTGTTNYGVLDTDYTTCDDWTSSESNLVHTMGDFKDPELWSKYLISSVSCSNNEERIYCFEDISPLIQKDFPPFLWDSGAGWPPNNVLTEFPCCIESNNPEGCYWCDFNIQEQILHADNWYMNPDGDMLGANVDVYNRELTSQELLDYASDLCDGYKEKGWDACDISYIAEERLFKFSLYALVADIFEFKQEYLFWFNGNTFVFVGLANMDMLGQYDDYETVLGTFLDEYLNKYPSYLDIADCSSNGDCEANEFCEFLGCSADAGICVPVPDDCSGYDVDPVCDCAGNTYNNDCGRRQAMAPKDYECRLITGTGGTETVSRKVSVPNYCEGDDICLLKYVATFDETGQTATRARFYTQKAAPNDYSTYYWDQKLASELLGSREDLVNGDTVGSSLLKRSDSLRLLDDKSDIETNANYWVLQDNLDTWSSELYAYPLNLDCYPLIWTEETEIIDIAIDVPDYCKDGNICFLKYIAYQGSWSDYTSRATRGRFYTQDSNGYWDQKLVSDFLGYTGSDLVNGDTVSSSILRKSDSLRLFDDKSDTETSPDQWVLYDNNDGWSSDLYACPVSLDCELIASTTTGEITNEEVLVPDYCKDGNICFLKYIAYQGSWSDASRATRGRFYTQDSDGYWDQKLASELLETRDDLVNGDTIGSSLLKKSDSLRLLDDKSDTETSPDQWVLYDNNEGWSSELYACQIDLTTTETAAVGTAQAASVSSRRASVDINNIISAIKESPKNDIRIDS